MTITPATMTITENETGLVIANCAATVDTTTHALTLEWPRALPGILSVSIRVPPTP